MRNRKPKAKFFPEVHRRAQDRRAGGDVPVSRRVRAYFACRNAHAEQPAIFDPGKSGAFLLDSPPAPWLDLGWIDNFQRASDTISEALRAGPRGAPSAQFRGALSARVDFDFREWGKLQMALAGGGEHMNVLAPDGNAQAQPSGGTPVAGVAVLSGSTASELVLGAGSVDAFAIGDLVAVDLDYQSQTGYVGSGIAAAYVKDPDDVNRDEHYVRRVTFNVGRVAEKTVTSVLLAQPLLGGVPADGASGAEGDCVCGSRRWVVLSGVVGIVCGGGRVGRESLLLLSAAESGRSRGFSAGRASGSGESDCGAGAEGVVLALPGVDGNDGAQVVCYRSYFPSNGAGVY